jgi:hypothetical protein
MTGQIADHFAQRKIVATDGFLEGTGLREHKDGYGNNCYGRRGTVVDTE